MIQEQYHFNRLIIKKYNMPTIQEQLNSNEIIFKIEGEKINEPIEVMRISKGKFYVKGQEIEDIHHIYEKMYEWSNTLNNMLQEKLEKIEKEFDEKIPIDKLNRCIASLAKQFLRTSAIELVKSVISQEIERLEKSKREIIFKDTMDRPFTSKTNQTWNQALSSSIASLQEIIKELK